jgi:hypothetical protein
MRHESTIQYYDQKPAFKVGIPPGIARALDLKHRQKVAWKITKDGLLLIKQPYAKQVLNDRLKRGSLMTGDKRTSLKGHCTSSVD